MPGWQKVSGARTGSRLTPKLLSTDSTPAAVKAADATADRGPVTMAVSSGTSGADKTRPSTSSLNAMSTQNLHRRVGL